LGVDFIMNMFIRNEKYDVAANFDNEWIILNSDQFNVTKINDIGGFCWTLLQQPQSVESLAQAIRGEFVGVDETVEEDIHHFLSDLLKFHLISHAS
jgi:Coenzyme PQQ synthesis protein D (PqqD)